MGKGKGSFFQLYCKTCGWTSPVLNYRKFTSEQIEKMREKHRKRSDNQGLEHDVMTLTGSSAYDITRHREKPWATHPKFPHDYEH